MPTPAGLRAPLVFLGHESPTRLAATPEAQKSGKKTSGAVQISGAGTEFPAPEVVLDSAPLQANFRPVGDGRKLMS
jgi:hypothetical protein